MSPTQQYRLTLLVKRFLDVMRFLFLAVAIIWPITVLVVGLNIPADPEQRHTDVNFFLHFQINSEIAGQATSQQDSKSEQLINGRGEVKLNNTDGHLSWYVAGLISEILLFIFLFGLLTMRNLFTSLMQGDTFTEKNAMRLKNIGYTFIGWHIASPLLQYFGSRFMLNEITFNVAGVQLFPGFEINIGGLFAGFAIIVLSGVLREATSIHRDQSLTI